MGYAQDAKAPLHVKKQKVEQLLRKGITDINQLAIPGISRTLVYSVAKECGIDIGMSLAEKRQIKRKKVEEMINANKSYKEIRRTFGCTIQYIDGVREEMGLPKREKRTIKSINEKRQQIADLLKEGACNKDICQIVGCSSGIVIKVKQLMQDGMPILAVEPFEKKGTSFHARKILTDRQCHEIQKILEQDPDIPYKRLAERVGCLIGPVIGFLKEEGLYVNRQTDKEFQRRMGVEAMARRNSGMPSQAQQIKNRSKDNEDDEYAGNPATLPITQVEKDPLFQEPSNEFVNKFIALTKRRRDIFEKIFEANEHRIIEEITEDRTDVLEKILQTDRSQASLEVMSRRPDILTNVLNMDMVALQRRPDLLNKILRDNSDYVRRFVVENEMEIYI